MPWDFRRMHTFAQNGVYDSQAERSYIRTIFGEAYLDSFIEFGEDIFESDASIVVLTTRRGYNSILLAERLSGSSMCDSAEKVYITDAAFLNMSSQLAEYYIENGCFPSILLVDDLLLHGRNLMHILHEMEDRIVLQIRATIQELDEERVVLDFAHSVVIYVFARVEKGVLLDARYDYQAKAKMLLSIAKIHELSGMISSVVAHSRIANTCYVPAVTVANTDRKRICEEGAWESSEWQYIDEKKTSYMGRRADIWVLPRFDGNALKYVVSVRMSGLPEAVKTMVPLVFLPDLDDDQTERLEDFVFSQLEEKDVERLKGFRTAFGRRTINELITMFFSTMVLYRFSDDAKIACQISSTEIRKLARNVYQGSLEETEAFLQRFLLAASRVTLEEFDATLDSILSGTSFGDVADGLIQGWETLSVRIEDVFYSMAYTDEFYAYRKHVREQRRRNFSTVFRYILENINVCREDIGTVVACVLQMLDTGVATISAFPDRDQEVTCYGQFIKAGEQALVILALRIYKYIIMLSLLYDACVWKGYDFRHSIVRCFDHFNDEEHKEYTNDEKKSVLQFVDDVESYGQTVNDWLGTYDSKLEIWDESKKIRQLRQQQADIARECIEYIG